MWHHSESYQSSPSGPSPPPSRQNKVILQREYREKEWECFNTLRDVIKDLTGQEPRTRQEILRKAIDVLSTASEIRKQSETHWEASSPTSSGAPSPIMGSEDRISAHVDYSTQSLHRLQNRYPYVEVDAVPCYGAHLDDQQFHFMSGMDSTLNQASYPVYGEGWFDYWFNHPLEGCLERDWSV